MGVLIFTHFSGASSSGLDQHVSVLFVKNSTQPCSKWSELKQTASLRRTEKLWLHKPLVNLWGRPGQQTQPAAAASVEPLAKTTSTRVVTLSVHAPHPLGRRASGLFSVDLNRSQRRRRKTSPLWRMTRKQEAAVSQRRPQGRRKTRP